MKKTDFSIPQAPDSARRRELLKYGLGATVLTWNALPSVLLAADMSALGKGEPVPPSKYKAKQEYGPQFYGGVSFPSLAPDRSDELKLSSGYKADILFAWGTPLLGEPQWHADGSNTAEEQRRQAGMYCSGIQFFPFPSEAPGTMALASSARGLLVVNHESTDEGLLHPDGMKTWSKEKVLKSQAAHGISIVETRRFRNEWLITPVSVEARRYDANSPLTFSGPAAGSVLLKTQASPDGLKTLGTVANSAGEKTPWETFLSGEAAFSDYFARTSGEVSADEKRYGIQGAGAGFRWHEFDPRFDLAVEANQANHFGWVLEVDPMISNFSPIKRTALGRFKHGSLSVTATVEHAVVYMADADPFECLYKFVSDLGYDHLSQTRNKVRTHLESGTLYVAKLNADGTGVWLPLVHGQGGLTPEAGFADQAEVLIKTRQAADKVGGTRIELPVKSVAAHPVSKTVYCSFGNYGDEPFGRIVRLVEQDDDPAALTFKWNVLVETGYKLPGETRIRGTFRGDAFGSPGLLAYDARSVCWVGTDADTRTLQSEAYERFGNNQLLAVNPFTGEARRLLSLPKGAAVRGVCFTPDSTSMFVSIQHPGRGLDRFSDPDNPEAISSWPDGKQGTRPRSTVVAVRLIAGGYIGR